MKVNKEQLKSIFIDRQIEHIRLVQDAMIFLEKNRDKLHFVVEEFALLRQVMNHDLTKFSDKFIHGFLKIAEFYENKKLGLSNDHIDESTLYEPSNLHYFTEPHHLEYHTQKNTRPTNVEICEMCCDWYANAYRNGERDYTKYFREELIHKDDFYKDNKEAIMKILLLLNEKYGK